MSAETAFLAPSIIFRGTPVSINDKGVVLFKELDVLKGLELSKVNVTYPKGLSPELGKQQLIAAYGTFETTYRTTACTLEQFTPQSKNFEPLQERLITFRDTFKEKSQKMGQNLTLLIPIRETAAYALKNQAGEVAARLYALAATISKDEPIDVLKTGEALLIINSNKAALSRFDDLLEKDVNNQAAWAGRYRALAQMNRWSELPKPLPNLNGLRLQNVTIPPDVRREKEKLTGTIIEGGEVAELLD